MTDVPPQSDPSDHEEADSSAAGVPVAEAGGDPADRSAAVPDDASIEELIDLLEKTSTEKAEYLDALRRSQADFENYRKRAAKQVADDSARAVASLVDKLLPVLDACDAAVHHGASEVEPVYAALLGTLEKEGLVRISPEGEAFDPNQHEAVMHEPAEDSDSGTVVSDVMRPGFSWNGRVLRAAMVKVRG